MATLTSHTLNGTDGTHAGGIRVTLSAVGGAQVFERRMDEGGRLSEEIPAEQIDPEATYELVFHIAPYWAARGITPGPQVRDEIVLRFRMTDPHARYHMPVILNPNSYATWWSA